MPRFNNHRVLITGAGAGIGRLMAEQCAAAGAEVIVTARRVAAAREVAERIVHSGGRAHAYGLDVSKVATVRKCHERVLDEHGPISMLINNAGVVFGGEFEHVDLQRHLDTFRVNCEGLMACTHVFMDDLIAAPRAHLVNIASASAFIGLPYGSTYAASKWAVMGFSESLRLEYRERGLTHIKVTTVCPSYIATGMFKGVKPPLFSPMLTPEKVVASILAGVARGDALIIEPPMARSVELLKGLLPRRLWDEVAKRTGVSTSMYGWKGKE